MTAPKFKDEWHDVIDHQDAKIQRQASALRRASVNIRCALGQISASSDAADELRAALAVISDALAEKGGI